MTSPDAMGVRVRDDALPRGPHVHVRPVSRNATEGLWWRAPAPSRARQGSYWLGGPDVLRPIRASVVVGDVFVVSEPTTGIFGSGVSLAEALLDLRAALHEHLEVLSGDEHLSEGLQAQLDFLRNHLAA